MNPALTLEEWADWINDGDLTPILEQYGEVSHQMAAVALHGQSFGFTREDVQFLRWCQKDARKKDGPLIAEGFDFERIADRIEALLPPEGK